MIEVTDEMVEAALDTLPSAMSATAGRDTRIRDAVAAVLAIVERDILPAEYRRGYESGFLAGEESASIDCRERHG